MSAEVLSNPFAFDDVARELLAMTLREYLDHPAVSRSTLWQIHSTSPYEFKWEQDQPDRETDAMRLGSGLHAAILEPDLFDTVVTTFPGKVRRGKEWEAFKVEHEGWIILTAAQYATLDRVRSYVHSLPIAQGLFTTGLAEQTVIWQDHVTLREVKARPDWINQDKGYLVDLKSTNDLDDWKLMRKVRDFGYHCQLAIMQEGLAALGIEVPWLYVFWVRTDKGAPLARVTRLPAEAIEEGRTIFREAMDTYARCMESDEWPAPTVFDPKKPELFWETQA